MVAVAVFLLAVAVAAVAVAGTVPGVAAAAVIGRQPRRSLHNHPGPNPPNPPNPPPVQTCTADIPPGYTVPCSTLTRQEGCESCQSTYPTVVFWSCCGCKKGYAFNETTDFLGVLGFCEPCPEGQTSDGGTSPCVASVTCAPGAGGNPCRQCRAGSYSEGGKYAACKRVPECKVPINCKRGRQGCSSIRNAKDGFLCSNSKPDSLCSNGICIRG